MVPHPRKELHEIVHELGKYPPDAFQFVQEGLSFTVDETHGELSEAQRVIHRYLAENQLDFDQLETLYVSGELPGEIAELLECEGTFDEMNRHVSGQNLCWGLRNYALQRWGALASTVLSHWNIHRTRDFGEIVFALVSNDFLQKQPHDSIDDFNDVYNFDEALDRAFRIDLRET